MIDISKIQMHNIYSWMVHLDDAGSADDQVGDGDPLRAPLAPQYPPAVARAAHQYQQTAFIFINFYKSALHLIKFL